MKEYFERLGIAGLRQRDERPHLVEGNGLHVELPKTVISDARQHDGERCAITSTVCCSTPKETDEERGVILSENATATRSPTASSRTLSAFSLPDSLISRRMVIGEEACIKAFKAMTLPPTTSNGTRRSAWCSSPGDFDAAPASGSMSKSISAIIPAAPHTPDPSLGAIKERGVVARVFRQAEAPAVEVSISNIRQTESAPTRA